MIVSAKPFPDLSALCSNNLSSRWLGFKFFSLGRDALFSGIQMLGLQKGDCIIIPAYMCESAISLLRAYGYRLIFIDVDENLNLSLDEVKNTIKKYDVKAVLVVHYFGFVVEISRIVEACHKLNVKVIEDFSHSFLSLLSQNRSAKKSDMEIFSMRKSLPVQDGGALRINTIIDSNRVTTCDRCMPFSSAIYYFLMRSIEWLAIIFRINIYGQIVTQLKNTLNKSKEPYEISASFSECRPSWQLEHYLYNEGYLQNVASCVHSNFSKLSKEARRMGLQMPFESLPSGCIPQAFLLYDDKGGLTDYLRSRGIGAWQWPNSEMPKEISNNPDVYPNAIFLGKHLVLLPVHQDITEKHSQYMIKTLERWILQCDKD